MTGFPGLNSTFRMSDLERGAERASCATMHSTDFPCIWRLGDRSNKDSSIPLSELRSWLYPLNLQETSACGFPPSVRHLATGVRASDSTTEFFNRYSWIVGG